MDLLLHQTVISILITVYVPISLAYNIFMIREKGWFNRLCYGIMGISLMINTPVIVKNYQQYIMGHFSGLPETISTNQTIADIIVALVFALVLIIYICVFIGRRRKHVKRNINRSQRPA